jgi:hypothetical protein
MHKVLNSFVWSLSALALTACSGTGDTLFASDPQLDHVLDLIDSGQPAKLTEAINIGDTLDVEASERLMERAQSRLGVLKAPQQSWSNKKLPVSWSAWPSGQYPYSATSAYGKCGQDTDLIARYSNVSFSNVSQLYLTTGNAATWLIAAKFGFQLTEWEADTVTRRVSICAGLSVLAGLPVFQNQLASMTLNVKSSSW